MAAISAAKKKCVIIALNVTDRNGRYNDLSPLVARGFLNDKVGSTYPFAVIASPDQTVRYAELSFKDLSAKSNTSKSIKAAAEKMESLKSALPSNSEKMILFSEGGAYSHLYITDVISETEFNFSREPNSTNGIIYNTKGKSKGFTRYIKRLMEIKSEAVKAETEKLIKELMPKFEVEPWTNTEGKTIQATFVSLADGQITLSMPRKSNPVTFALTMLNAASQARTEELTAEVTKAEEKIKELK